MQSAKPLPPREEIAGARAWRRAIGPVLVLAIVVTFVRIVYLFAFCPYSLVEDEAQYWEWSRRLGWSYYSKGPGVAWLIRAMTELFGTSEGVVRIGAALSGGVTIFAVGGLAADAARDRRAGAVAALCVLLVPVFQISSLLMTIDAPYVACWVVACWAAWRALHHGSSAAWVVLGAAVGVGFLFKYTTLLLLPGLAVYAIWRRFARGSVERSEIREHSALVRYGAQAVGALLALLGLAPVLIWNAGHDWVTIRHLLGHLGISGGDVSPTQTGGWHYDPRWTLEFVGTQFALIGPAMFLVAYAVIAAIRARRADARDWLGRMFLICCGAPILLFYLAVTLVTEAEGNWPMAGYVSLLSLVGWHVRVHMADLRIRIAQWRESPRPRRGWFRHGPWSHTRIAWHATLVAGVIVGIMSLRLDWAATPVNAVYRAIVGGGDVASPGHTSARPGVLLPIHRLTGGRQLAQEAYALAQRLRDQTGKEPFYIAQHYGRASILAFYLPGRPTVYCASSLLGGRGTQWDYWPDTDLADLSLLGGRPAFLSGAYIEQWQAAFDHVEDVGVLPSEPKSYRRSYLGSGYRGF